MKNLKQQIAEKNFTGAVKKAPQNGSASLRTPLSTRRPDDKPPRAPDPYQPMPTPKVLQSKHNIADSRRTPFIATQKISTALHGKTIQRGCSGIVQATKFYPNLHPGAVEPINPNNIFRLDSFADQYRLHKVNSHGVNVP